MPKNRINNIYNSFGLVYYIFIIFIRWIKFNFSEFPYSGIVYRKMENTLETTTAKAIAGRFRNNGIGQPQMYIDTLMITRILLEWGFPRGSGPADRQDSDAGHPRAPDEGGGVGAGASASLVSRFPLPVKLSPV